MFNDANLPLTEAFVAMRRDLQLAKAKRNELALENVKLKRDLDEANLKGEQYVLPEPQWERLTTSRWAQILRNQGVIS